MPCHRLIYDEYMQKSITEINSEDNDSVYFHPDGTFAYQGNLVFKAKNNTANMIEEEHTIQVQDAVAIEDELVNLASTSITLEPIEPSKDINSDSLVFFRNMYRHSTTKDILGELCQKLIKELNINPAELIEEVKRFNL